MADAAMAAKANGDGADGAAKAKLGKSGTAELAKAKAANGVNVVDNPDGTYTLTGKTQTGHEWSKTFVSTSGSSHTVGAPDPSYIAKVKAHLSQGLGNDQLGQDSDADGQYKGKSLEAGKGGRSAMMKDRITVELVNKGYGHEDAESIARKQTYDHGVKKYGADQMNKWASKSGSSEAGSKS